MASARSPVVVAAGMTPFGAHPGRTLPNLGAEAVRAALGEAGLEWNDIQAVICGNVFGGIMPGQRIAREFGGSDIPITNVENACASGGTALHHAVRMIEAGELETVLVVGVEKLSALGGGLLPLDQDDLEVQQGLSMPASYAMRAQRYMHDYGAKAADMALVSVKNHRNAALNPYATFSAPWTVDDVLQSRKIADPLTLYMCCPNSDGAAAVVVSTPTFAKRRNLTQIHVAGSALVSGVFQPNSHDVTRPATTVAASRAAYEQAGVGPEDLDFVELHDAFAIAEMLSYEALGLAGPGEAVELLQRGETEPGGSIPVNVSGGLMGRGHPVGATGVAQVAEAFWQLTGRAGQRQLDAPCSAATHVTGGGISGYDNGACTVHVFTT